MRRLGDAGDGPCPSQNTTRGKGRACPVNFKKISIILIIGLTGHVCPKTPLQLSRQGTVIARQIIGLSSKLLKLVNNKTPTIRPENQLNKSQMIRN